MRKPLYLALLLCLCLACCGGCGNVAEETPAATLFTAADNIFTYEQIDPAKTKLVVSRTGNIYIDGFLDAFEAANPDIQCISIDITGGDSITSPLDDWMKHDCTPDLIFTSAGFFSRENAADYFEDLSANPNVEAYESEALFHAAVNGSIYCFPGPSNITCMLYNKTLFAQYGWQVPQTFDEFVALCVQIREDTDGAVQPWNPNAKYSNEFVNVAEAFVYPEVFGGVDNRTWYDAFTDGRATFAGQMEPYYRCLQALIDNGLLTEDFFSYSATARGKEFAAGQIAMINFNITNYDNDEYDFGYFPIPTTQGEVGYLCNSFSCQLGVPLKQHSEAETEAIQRFLTYFSSVEGQLAFIGNTLMVSNVKNVPLQADDDMTALQPALDAGHLFQQLNFYRADHQPNFSLTGDAKSMLLEGRTVEECIAAVDAKPYLDKGEVVITAPEVVGAAAEDFTILETSFLLADMYRETAGADIGLIANNVAFRGNLMRIFAGDLNSSNVTTLKPRSFANDTTLIKVAMTGQQLLAALNDPCGSDTSEDCVYAYSGLICTIAPWQPLGEKVLSVTLADGSPLDPAQTYTVAIWDGTVYDQYISEVLETYEGSFQDLLTAKLRADSPIAPAEDGRIELVWDVPAE